MAKDSSKFLNTWLVVLLFVGAAFALLAIPDTLCAEVPLGRRGLLFYLAGGTVIFWLYLRRGRRHPTTDPGQEQVSEEVEEPMSAQEGEAPLRIDQVRERIRMRKGRKRDAD